MAFNKEKFKEDIDDFFESIFAMFMIVLVIGWIGSGFGIAAIIGAFVEGYPILGYVLIAVDLGIIGMLIRDRYFIK